jgi:predicted nucleic acid-binding protein
MNTLLSVETRTNAPNPQAHQQPDTIIAPLPMTPIGYRKSPLHITLDTNVWLDWLVFDDPGIHALQSWVAQGQACLTSHSLMRVELEQVLNRLCWRGEALANRAPGLLARFDALVTTRACVLPPCSWKCSDPDDQIYLDWLTAGFTNIVLTKDKALLRLARILAGAGRGTIEHPRRTTVQWFMAKMQA